jgi:hypothetical protein
MEGTVPLAYLSSPWKRGGWVSSIASTTIKEEPKSAHFSSSQIYIPFFFFFFCTFLSTEILIKAMTGAVDLGFGVISDS